MNPGLWEATLSVLVEKQWRERYEAASPEQRIQMKLDREKAEQKETEERRHREICAAIRASKPKKFKSKSKPDSSGLLKFGLGFLIGKSL